jgi:hypothetical protein
VKDRQDTQPGGRPEHPALAENEQATAVHHIRKGPGGERQQEDGQGARRLNERDYQR